MNEKVDIGNIIPISTVDWHKKSSCTIFFSGCPFICPYCQNYNLLKKTNIVDISFVEKKIIESRDFVNATVFSGGEPTVQEKPLELLMNFSIMQGLLTGIQTNGYYPSVIRKLIDLNIVDKIFLDLKAPPSDMIKYKAITGVEDANRKVLESFNIISLSHIDCEIRTTVFRPFINNIFDIAQFLEQNNFRGTFVLQTGIPENSPEEYMRKEKRIPIDEMRNMTKYIAKNTGFEVTYR